MLFRSGGVITNAGAELKEGFDSKHGGWGRAPKFPSPSHPAFQLLFGMKYRDADAVKQVLKTCDHMAAGGIYDQVGDGFSRYSVDAEWLVPHFEKMLYDNAQLTCLYLDCYSISGEARYADTARGIIRYVLRDMMHREGGFYSAEDADSEGKEGKFYCWTKDEIQKLLTAPEAALVIRRFGVTEKGNFVDHSDPDPLPKQNVLSLVHPKIEENEKAILASAMQKLFTERAKRVRPHLDEIGRAHV